MAQPYEPPTSLPPTYPQQPPVSYSVPSHAGGDHYNQQPYYGGGQPQSESYGNPQGGYYNQPGAMYYPQQQIYSRDGGPGTFDERGSMDSSREGEGGRGTKTLMGCCAGALACVCCMDLCWNLVSSVG
jgi:hypothetical protein